MKKVDLVPGVGSPASQSSESHVTSREEITTEGSLDTEGTDVVTLFSLKPDQVYALSGAEREKYNKDHSQKILPACLSD